MGLLIHLHRSKSLFGILKNGKSFSVIKNSPFQNAYFNRSKLYTHCQKIVSAPINILCTPHNCNIVQQRCSTKYDETQRVPFRQIKLEQHAFQWFLERLFAVGLLTTIPVGFYYQRWEDFEYGILLLVATHMYWGLEAIVVDYVRPSIFGTIIPKIAHASLILFTVLLMFGVGLLIGSEGLCSTIIQIWHAF